MKKYELTAEQAAKILDDAWRGISNNGDINLAYKMAIDTLRGPVPDPDTGLMPCGCGGKIFIYGDESALSKGFGFYVMCTNCGITSAEIMTKKDAIEAWNRAMGWKGDAKYKAVMA